MKIILFLALSFLITACDADHSQEQKQQTDFRVGFITGAVYYRALMNHCNGSLQCIQSLTESDRNAIAQANGIDSDPADMTIQSAWANQQTF